MYWISLLRGINVGGRNIVPMKELRSLLEAHGFTDVRTFIQSGNCVFKADGATAEDISQAISTDIASNYGFQPAVLSMSSVELDTAISNNPYAESGVDTRCTHFYFLETVPDSPDLAKLNAIRSTTEQFTLIDSVFYLLAPEGIGRSKLATSAEKSLGVAATARNLRTVLKIQELSSAPSL